METLKVFRNPAAAENQITNVAFSFQTKFASVTTFHFPGIYTKTELILNDLEICSDLSFEDFAIQDVTEYTDILKMCAEEHANPLILAVFESSKFLSNLYATPANKSFYPIKILLPGDVCKFWNVVGIKHTNINTLSDEDILERTSDNAKKKRKLKMITGSMCRPLYDTFINPRQNIPTNNSGLMSCSQNWSNLLNASSVCSRHKFPIVVSDSFKIVQSEH